MATANELLAMVVDSGVDKTLIIDNDLRTIIIPKSVTNLGTEFEKDVHRLQFQMPRYFNDIDLSELNIRINYMNANSEGDIYAVTDKKILSSTITFSWLVGAHALMYKGPVNFIVCLKKSDTAGNVLKEFNTTPASLPVLEGLEVDTAALETPMIDILEQLLSLTESKLSEVESAGAEQIAKVSAKSAEEQENIANKGTEVLATIPEDYQTTYKLANEGVRTKADAIVCSSVGDVITVTDSSDDNLRGLNIFGKTTQVKTTGKNLLELTVADRDVSGATLKVNADKSLTLNGTVSTNTSVVLGKFRHSGEFVMSAGVSFDDMNASYFYMTLTDDTNIGWYGKEVPFNHDGTERSLILVVIAGTYSNLTFYPMIRYSSIADSTYEPYTGGIPAPNPDYPQEIVSVENPSITVRGNNLWNHEYDVGDMTNVFGWGNNIWNNASVIKVLKPNTKYTMSFDVTCLTMPSYSTVFSDDCGFVLHSANPNGDYIRLAMSTGEGVFKVGEKRTSVRTFTTPSNVDSIEVGYTILKYTQRFLQADGTAVYATVRFDNVQLVEGTEVGKYEDYTRQTLDLSRTLPAIPVTSGGNYTDSDGQQWVCDEIDFERGVYVQRIHTYRPSMINTLASGSKNNRGNIKLPRPASTFAYDKVNGVCSHFDYNSTVYSDTGDELGFIVSGETMFIRFTSASDITTLDQALTWLSGESTNGTPLTVTYILAEPIETPLTADEIAAFQELRSNYPNTTVLNDSGATMKLKYNADTETWIKNLIDERIAAAIASIQ